jgi:hypothetical protein
MLRDYHSEIPHWRRMAKLTRVAGIALIVVGGANAAVAIRAVLDPRVPFVVDSVADDGMAARLIAAVFCSMVAILGVALVSMRTYRPDLGDRSVLDKVVDPFDTFGGHPRQRHRGARSWWTGDPRPH